MPFVVNSPVMSCCGRLADECQCPPAPTVNQLLRPRYLAPAERGLVVNATPPARPKRQEYILVRSALGLPTLVAAPPEPTVNTLTANEQAALDAGDVAGMQVAIDWTAPRQGQNRQEAPVLNRDMTEEEYELAAMALPRLDYSR